jgi:phage-related protein
LRDKRAAPAPIKAARDPERSLSVLVTGCNRKRAARLPGADAPNPLKYERPKARATRTASGGPAPACPKPAPEPIPRPEPSPDRQPEACARGHRSRVVPSDRRLPRRTKNGTRRPAASRRAIPAATARHRVALRLACVFYRSEAGNEPVREWLRNEVLDDARKTNGTDIKTVQATWPIDKPLVDNLGPALWEVRSTHDKIEYRVIFMIEGRSIVLLHGFTKNSAKTKKTDIDLANKRKATWEKNR